jgi:hypothetical protein
MELDAVYRDPETLRTHDVRAARIYTALFGFLYFARHKVWKHALGGAVLTLMTLGMSWLLYPIYAEGIMRKTFVGRHWTPIPSEDVDRTGAKFLVLMVTLLWTTFFCSSVASVITAVYF